MKTYIFDIDGTICTTTDGDYDRAMPLKKQIEHINQLYDEGNKIFFQTARGMGRTNNSPDESYRLFYKYTKEQLDNWGVKYHRLFLGKPAGDIYVDDKGIFAEKFFNKEKNELFEFSTQRFDSDNHRIEKGD